MAVWVKIVASGAPVASDGVEPVMVVLAMIETVMIEPVMSLPGGFCSAGKSMAGLRNPGFFPVEWSMALSWVARLGQRAWHLLWLAFVYQLATVVVFQVLADQL